MRQPVPREQGLGRNGHAAGMEITCTHVELYACNPPRPTHARFALSHDQWCMCPRCSSLAHLALQLAAVDVACVHASGTSKAKTMHYESLRCSCSACENGGNIACHRGKSCAPPCPSCTPDTLPVHATRRVFHSLLLLEPSPNATYPACTCRPSQSPCSGPSAPGTAGAG